MLRKFRSLQIEDEVYHIRFGQVLALTWSGSHPTGDKEGESARAAAINFGTTVFLWILRGKLHVYRCDLWEEFSSDDFYWNRMA